MLGAASSDHTLVVYSRSPRADATLARLAEAGSARLTVLVLVKQESGSGCCDTRSVLWNGISRELAEKDLMRASSAMQATHETEFEVIAYTERHEADVLIREAANRSADRMVLADPARAGMSRRELRRLRSRSPIPVDEPVP